MYKEGEKLYQYNDGLGTITYNYLFERDGVHHIEVNSNSARRLKLNNTELRAYKNTEESALAYWYRNEKTSAQNFKEECESKAIAIGNKLKKLQEKYGYLEEEYPEEFV